MTATKPGDRCSGENCKAVASNLQCPNCQKLGIDRYFCTQECFRNSWSSHKLLHKTNKENSKREEGRDDGKVYDPFPKFMYTGKLRAAYPLSDKRSVLQNIRLPDYAQTGIPSSERKAMKGTQGKKPRILNSEEIAGMRRVCRLAREVLDIAAASAVPGVTTDYIDKIVHEACMERDAYPSPLNYYNFPKSVCTSVNEVICHGIPDQRKLCDGDILNIDVTLYHGGFHGDLNETYYIGEKARKNADAVKVVETARDCLEVAIAEVRPGMPFKQPGNVIEALAESRGCGVVRSYCGHGINDLFHCAPNIPHYARSKTPGEAKPGVCFTIEPMITLGEWSDRTWPDNWTSVTSDGSLTAQFEHTLLVTETGVEILTARLPNSPGGKVGLPSTEFLTVKNS